MKTFINVLYRRILYKIPLKFLLILFAIVAIFIASFSNATNYQCTPTYVSSQAGSLNNSEFGVGWTYNLPAGQHYELYCVTATYGNFTFKINCAGNSISLSQAESYCITYDSSITKVCATSDRGNANFGYSYWKQDCFSEPMTKAECKITYDLIEESECSVMSSLECQTNYSLIPISSVNQSYCVNNNLCPSSECPTCPIGSGGISNVYINNILHVGAPNIVINIPQEISRDYAYTTGGYNMNIDIAGYNVDYEYMDNIVDIQNYKPDNTDLQSIITDIIPLFIPGLVIILFLYFIFKFIKKIF